MGRRHNIYLIQPNFRYGNNVFVPYSVGTIQAYAMSIPEVRENFTFNEPIFLREDFKRVVRKMISPSIVGFSCYLWNWEYNKLLAQYVRVAYPNALIVFGGTQIPDASQEFFLTHPYVDILIHHEGEFSFASILLEFLSEKSDYSRISGLSIRIEGDQTLKTSASNRIEDLSKLFMPI